MIEKKLVLDWIKAYRGRAHPEFSKDFTECFIDRDLNDFSKRDFYTLDEVLTRSPSYIGHNGTIYLGLTFNEVVSCLGLHPDPAKIPLIDYPGSGDSGDKTRQIRIRAGSWVQDVDPALFGVHLMSLFFSRFCGVSDNTFQSLIIEGGYGTRIDIRGQMKSLVTKLSKEKIPAFFYWVDLSGKVDGEPAYVVNGFGV